MSLGDGVIVQVTNPETPFGGVQVMLGEIPVLVCFNQGGGGGGGGGGGVTSVFGRTGDVIAQCGDYSACYPALARGLPPGGSTGQALVKTDNNDYDTGWINLPAGGGSVTNVAAGTLHGLFTTNVLNPTTTPNIQFNPVAISPNLFFGNGSLTTTQNPDFVAIGFGNLGGRASLAQLPNVPQRDLLGRSSNGGTGPPQYISIGTGLTMSGTVLKTTGQGISVAGYMFSVSTAAADPTSGKLSMDNVSSASAANLYVSSTNQSAGDMTAYLSALQIGDTITLQEQSDLTNLNQYSVSGAPVNHSGWFTVPVTFIESSQGLTPAGGDLLNVTVPVQTVFKQKTYPTPTTLNTVVSCLRAAGLCA